MTEREEHQPSSTPPAAEPPPPEPPPPPPGDDPWLGFPTRPEWKSLLSTTEHRTREK